ncbi:MAG: hypothetical protein WAK93_12180, partial [Solirubrobacteraceae bacterium]
MPDDVLERLRRANPVPDDLPAPPLEPLLDRLEVTPARPPARRLGGVVGLSLAVAVVVLVGGVALVTAGHGHRAASPGTTVPTRSSSLVLRAQGLGGGALNDQVIRQAVAVLDRRLASVSSALHASRSGADQITIAGVTPSERAQVLDLTRPGWLSLYDWEANALTPSGKTVASRLRAQDPTALTISQGSANAAPGSPGAGGLALYEAVKLASKQPVAPARPTLARLGPEYYLFGSPGSAACAAAAKDNGTTPIQGEHCLLSGPAIRVRNLQSELPTGVSVSEGQVITVPQGTVVLQAANPSASDQIKPTNPNAAFFVLKDNVSILSHDITNPQPSTDQGGSPDVTFGFTPKGEREFSSVTKQIAHRGAEVGFGSQALDQHFAI